jgi:hypothetical protein
MVWALEAKAGLQGVVGKPDQEGGMKIALLTNYPWVDRVDWKKELVSKLRQAGHIVEVHYGKVGICSHLNTYLKLRRYA